jgi:DNA repair protein RadC
MVPASLLRLRGIAAGAPLGRRHARVAEGPPARRERAAPPSSRGRSPLSSAGSVGPEHEIAARQYAQLAEPEVDLLLAVFRAPVARKLAAAPGGWRTLSDFELSALGLRPAEQAQVRAMQALVQRSFPPLPTLTVSDAAELARVYQHRLAGHTREVFIAIGLDGHNHVIANAEIATGGPHAVQMTNALILKAMVRAGAPAFIVLHNHPSGDPAPSEHDVFMTRLLAEAAGALEIHLLDHLIIAARGGGYASLRDLGLMPYAGDR